MKKFSNKYRLIKIVSCSNEQYNIKAIRIEDRYRIMKWRNDQIFHLRQKKPLTKKEQDKYFDNIVRKSFLYKYPKQFLFSFFDDGIMVGYGGLVHLDWRKKSAEISFLICTERNQSYFSIYWNIFLELIEQIAFKELNLECIFTYSFELRPELYPVLNKREFYLKKRIGNDIVKDGKLVDSLIHIKWKNIINVRKATIDDKNLLFKWVNESRSRKNSINSNQITWKEHSNWYDNKLSDKRTQIFIFKFENPVGVLRLEEKRGVLKISFNVCKKERGKGIGDRIIHWVVHTYKHRDLLAEVRKDNIPSKKIFINNGFYAKKQFLINNEIFISYEKNS